VKRYLALLLFIGCVGDQNEPQPVDVLFEKAQTVASKMKRGINIGNTLEPPEVGDWNNDFVSEYFFWEKAGLLSGPRALIKRRAAAGIVKRRISLFMTSFSLLLLKTHLQEGFASKDHQRRCLRKRSHALCCH